MKAKSPHAASAAAASFFGTIAQIVVIDVVFSLDSVITAVGMANELAIMMAAVVISVGVMMVASGPVAAFVNRHPTVKMLALSFLLLIGTMLVADGFGMHVSKGYMYAAIGFSVLVEVAEPARRPPPGVSGEARIPAAGLAAAARCSGTFILFTCM